MSAWCSRCVAVNKHQNISIQPASLVATHICLKVILVIHCDDGVLLILDLILLQHSCDLMLLLRNNLRGNLCWTRRLIKMQRLRFDLVKHAYRCQQIGVLRGPAGPPMWETNVEGFLISQLVESDSVLESSPLGLKGWYSSCYELVCTFNIWWTCKRQQGKNELK